MERKGLFTIDAAVGIILSSVILGLILFGAMRVENVVKARRLAEANSLLGTYMAKYSLYCRSNPTYSGTVSETLGKDTFTVTINCSSVSPSLVQVAVEVKGKGVDVKGETYASR